MAAEVHVLAARDEVGEEAVSKASSEDELLLRRSDRYRKTSCAVSVHRSDSVAAWCELWAAAVASLRK